MKQKKQHGYPNNTEGGILIITLVFLTIFVVIGGALLSLITRQQKIYRIREAEAKAFQIAEAGLNYYRWHLAHEPEDYADGTGETDCNPCGPYIHNIEGVGQFSLEITPPQYGSKMVKIKSIGWTNNLPETKKILAARYGIPSLAKYSFLTNSSAWIGVNETITGLFHSNDGIRMDGSNDSVITSAKETYTCYPEHGCVGTKGEVKNGIWGIGRGKDLWRFPVTTVDFNAITTDLARIKTLAEQDGVCISGDTNGNCQTGGNSQLGYHIIFLSNGTFNLYKIKQLEPCLWQLDENWANWLCVPEEIKSETAVGNYQIPENGIIYVQGDLWVEGVVNGRVTIAAAQLPGNPNTYKNIRINNNLTYLSRDETNCLGLIAQDNIWVPRHAPSNMQIDGVLIAQHGRIARNYYNTRRITSSIKTYGSIISNKTWTWTWLSNGLIVDGYTNTTFAYDSNLIYNPPPAFPTSGEYEFISWEELVRDEAY